MKSKSIAIIGSSSFLVSSLLKLLPEDYKVTLYGRSFPDSEKYNKVSFDYPNTPIDFKELLNKDIIVFAAASGVQTKDRHDFDSIFSLNAFLPIRLLLFLSSNAYAGKIFTFGSYFEVGNNEQKKYLTEEEVVQSANQVPNHYCSSKRILSKFIFNEVLNMKYYHFILPTIYGPGENSNRLIPYIVNSIKTNQQINLTGGDQVRQYIYINDFAKLVLDFIDNSYPSGVYNVTAKEEYSVKEIVKLITEFFKKDAVVNFGKTIRDDVSMKVLLLDSNKLSNTTEWKPGVYIKEVLQSYLQ